MPDLREPQATIKLLEMAANRLDIQTDFAGQLTDTLKEGVGNLIDADLAEESATL